MRTDERLMCCPHRLTYDWNTKIGRLGIEEEDCTDMTGCIKFFESIDPEVRQIEVFSGDRFDIVYRRDAGGEWRGLDPQRGLRTTDINGTEAKPE